MARWLEIPFNAYQELKQLPKPTRNRSLELEIPFNAYQELKRGSLVDRNVALLTRNSF